MASSRLRKAFRYPDDDNETDNSPQEGIDEEEQDKLIAQIATEDARSIAFYRVFFLALPALALVYLVLLLFVMPYPASADVTANPYFYTLCTVSLIMSLGIAYDIELPADTRSPGILHPQDPSSFPPELARLLHLCRENLTIINAGVCGILSLVALSSRSRTTDFQTSAPITFSVIPVLVVFSIVAVARRELRPVDVAGLKQMKYAYKGA